MSGKIAGIVCNAAAVVLSFVVTKN